MGETRTVLRPHSLDQDALTKSAQIYARGKTPEITTDGRIAELDVTPGGPDLAAKHLREIQATFGREGIEPAVRGLQVTRSNQFVLQMFAVDRGLHELVRSAEPHNGGVPAALRSNAVGSEVPADVRRQFEGATGHDIGAVRLMNNSEAYEAADAVGARAFAVGRRIFFGRGEYNPHSDEGRELLMHELVHTVQQGDAPAPLPDSLTVSDPGDVHEREADAVARAITASSGGAAANDSAQNEELCAGRDPISSDPLHMAQLQRAISFTTAAGAFNPNNIQVNEDAAGFVLTSPVGTFEWQPDVTIHGDPGDAFAEWETAHHQVGKGFWFNVWWGTGADRTHRRRVISGGLPMRDATAAGNTWYSDWRAQGFAADGDVRTPVMRDTPSTGSIPWANPVAGRGGTRGWFNYGFGFVSTLSTRHIPDGTGAGAFRHLNHVHWNFGVDGTFDTTAAIGGRVTLNGGAINRSGVISGIDSSFPPMHGGPIINDNFTDTDT